MTIITRQEAITAKLSRYFTGVPCKRNHICERYTQSSVCIECLHPKFEAADIAARKQARLQVEEEKYVRRFAVARLDKLRIGVYTPNLPQVRDLVYALTVAREPILQPEDTQAPCRPQYRGPNTFLHAFRLHREDFDTVIAFNNALTPPATAEAIIADRDARNNKLLTAN